MKIKLDENLPDRLVSALTGFGHDVDTVYLERLNGRIDADVWNVTQAARRFFITQDLEALSICSARRRKRRAASTLSARM